ncbi:TetR/AcrR family transcriptional regulator [Aestuariimicrobium ganziense]|uniref:TetR/AcrR family transcriptional regulator n=1 Tax=Aestuariimicrobium ganziense TaxID=2773677 RepID=UPI001941E05D|nr:TetR/AcrR family transcriptional regulator [Aestuariimicrobium ganziense]
MPKISAPTVAEHRTHVLTALVDAAEALLRRGEPLTAGTVSSAAGIARNSIYRYVNSVDDLAGLVLERHLPGWVEAVSSALEQATSPDERVLTWVTANLREAGATGHGWLIGLGGALAAGSSSLDLLDDTHHLLHTTLFEAWDDLADAQTAPVAAALTQGLVEAGFGQLDAGVPTDVVVDVAGRAARALVETLRS